MRMRTNWFCRYLTNGGGRGSGKGDAESCIIPRICKAGISVIGAMAATSAMADVVVVTPPRIPPQVVPTFKEVGAPAFYMNAGNPNAGGGGGGGGGCDGPCNGGGGNGGYNGGGGNGNGTLASGYDGQIGQAIGSGECVALAQADSNVGLTKTWTPGEQAQGNDLAPGTVIATFGDDGTYTNTPGQSHTAIYLRQDADGIWVEDQWQGQAAHVRHIDWTTTNAYEEGSKYYVVSHKANS